MKGISLGLKVGINNVLRWSLKSYQNTGEVLFKESNLSFFKGTETFRKYNALKEYFSFVKNNNLKEIFMAEYT